MTDQGRGHRVQRLTLATVAQIAGVSTATASKVVNDRPDVAPDTRRRVAAVINELGYESTTAPRAIHLDPVVAVVFDSLANSYSTQVLRGVLTAAGEYGVDIVVEVLSEQGSAVGPKPLSAQWLRSAAHKGWKGVLAVTTDLSPAVVTSFRKAGVQVVAIDPPNALDDTLVSVGSTNYIGGTQATDHLLELGHLRIGVAAGPSSSPVARERIHGFRSALEAADVRCDESLIVHGDFEYPAGVRMGTVLLSRDHPPTAIIAASDATALGVLESARRMGVRVPQDLSVVGYDDSPAALSSAPPLTTVRQPMSSVGRVALRNLFLQNAGQDPASHHIQLATTLVVRESTAPPSRA
jgi:LacI family transcriptional regulator